MKKKLLAIGLILLSLPLSAQDRRDAGGPGSVSGQAITPSDFAMIISGFAQPFTSLMAATKFAQFAAQNVVRGGMNLLAVTNGATASDIPLYIRGYSGSAAPTAFLMQFDASKTDGSTGVAALAAQEKAFQWQTNNGNTLLMSMLGSGFLGLGITAPSMQLHFSGSAQSSGTIRVTGSSFAGASNAGAEIYYSGAAIFQAFDRTASTYQKVILNGTETEVQNAGTAVFNITTNGYLKPLQRTLAQIQAATPGAADVGALVTCTNCAGIYSVCRATGTTIGGFSLGASGTLAECK